MKIKKLERTELLPENRYNGIVAFQRIEITYGTYGGLQTEVFDSKILEDGTQYIIDGNGWIDSDMKVD